MSDPVDVKQADLIWTLRNLAEESGPGKSQDLAMDCVREIKRAQRLQVERDAFHAYAAFLQAQSTMTKEFEQWTPEGAVEWVAKVASGTFHRLGWTRNDVTTHDACIAAVAKRGEADPCSIA